MGCRPVADTGPFDRVTRRNGGKISLSRVRIAVARLARRPAKFAAVASILLQYPSIPFLDLCSHAFSFCPGSRGRVRGLRCSTRVALDLAPRGRPWPSSSAACPTGAPRTVASASTTKRRGPTVGASVTREESSRPSQNTRRIGASCQAFYVTMRNVKDALPCGRLAHHVLDLVPSCTSQVTHGPPRLTGSA
jgi:hypothetical protein